MVGTGDGGSPAGDGSGERAAHGPGSPATFGRRLAALVVDWLACVLVARAFGLGAFGPLTIFFAMSVLLLTTLGATFGQRLLGLAVTGPDGHRPGPGPTLLRTLLVCLVVPPLVTGPDGRGLHDRLAGTAVVRTR